MEIIDYKNIEHDLVIEEGDFVKHNAVQDHIEDILLYTKGSFRLNPLVGADLVKFINAPWSTKTIISTEKTIRLQLEMDGYTIRRVNAKDLSNLEIDATK